MSYLGSAGLTKRTALAPAAVPSLGRPSQASRTAYGSFQYGCSPLGTVLSAAVHLSGMPPAGSRTAKLPRPPLCSPCLRDHPRLTPNLSRLPLKFILSSSSGYSLSVAPLSTSCSARVSTPPSPRPLSPSFHSLAPASPASKPATAARDAQSDYAGASAAHTHSPPLPPTSLGPFPRLASLSLLSLATCPERRLSRSSTLFRSP